MTATHPAELAVHDLHGSWTAAPGPGPRFDPFSFAQRMGAYRSLIEATNDGGRFGADNRGNPLWGLMFQHQWQFRTGRLGPASRDDGRIDPAAPWGYGNYVLCVVPWLGAVAAGTVPDARLAGPDGPTPFDYARGGPGGSRYVPAALHAGVADWRAYFELVAATPPGGDDEPLRSALWRAHKTCLDVVAAQLGHDDAAGFHTPQETEFLRGWCRMVDFLWAAAWRTDFDSMTDHGLDVLPERMLGPDRPGEQPDLPGKVRRNVRSVLGLARTTDRRYAVNLWLWRRIMRTREARDDVLPLLDAVFDRRRDNRAQQLRLIGYLLRP
ncbi:MAG: Leg1-related protein [Pseudonocardia sediminis]